MQHLQYKSPRYNIKIAGLFAPAISTFIHRTTTHFISLFCYPHPYKNRSPQPITPPRFAPLYRTSSPLITVPKTLPWQTNNIFFIFYSPQSHTQHQPMSPTHFYYISSYKNAPFGFTNTNNPFYSDIFSIFPSPGTFSKKIQSHNNSPGHNYFRIPSHTFSHQSDLTPVGSPSPCSLLDSTMYPALAKILAKNA